MARNPKPVGKPIAAQPERSWKPWHFYALLCIITFVAYSNSFGLDLASDAYGIVHSDSRVRQFTAENLNLIFTRDYWWPAPADNLYRPLTLLSYLFNFAILGDGENAAGYHFLNFLLHALNVCLLFYLCERLLRNRIAALFAAALWAVHPIATESVTNVSGRADLLAAAAMLGALVLHAGRQRLAWAGIFALTLAGALSKENALVLPGLLLLWDTLDLKQFREELRTRIPGYAAAAAALGVVFLLRYQALHSRPWPKLPYLENPLVTADFWVARLTAVKVLGMELWLLLCPVSLSSDRSWHQITFSGWSDAEVWISLLVILAMIALALMRYPGDRATYFGAGLLGITLLPTSNLIVLIGATMAERFLYLPAAGFAIALAALAFQLKPRTGQIVLGAVVLLYAGRTFVRNYDWRDNLTLESADVANAPGSSRLHDLLGRGLYVRSSTVNIDRAIQEGEAAWAILRPLPFERINEQTLYHLGLYYGTKGESLGGISTAPGKEWYAKGIAILERAREVSRAGERDFDRLQMFHGKPPPSRTGYQPIYKTLGLLYSRVGRHSEALEILRSGRNLNPDTAEFYSLIAGEYIATGKPQWAGITVIEDSHIQGMTPAIVNGLRQLLSPIPEASCAISMQGDRPILNYGCPWFRAATCVALDDLAQAYTEARRPDRVAELRQKAVTQFACAVK